MALLLTGSLKSAVLWCGCCGAVICTADIILGAWSAWDKRQARRALDKHACGKPERAWMTDDERHAWLGIILKSYSNEELDAYTRRGEQLRVNRGRR